MTRAVVRLLASAVLVSSAAGGQPACPRCDPLLVLDSFRWDCLVRRLPELGRFGTPIVFFTLTPKSCAGPLGPERGGPRLPAETPDRAAPKVFQLSREQIACLARAKGKVERSGGLYRFDFAKACR